MTSASLVAARADRRRRRASPSALGRPPSAGLGCRLRRSASGLRLGRRLGLRALARPWRLRASPLPALAFAFGLLGRLSTFVGLGELGRCCLLSCHEAPPRCQRSAGQTTRPPSSSASASTASVSGSVAPRRRASSPGADAPGPQRGDERRERGRHRAARRRLAREPVDAARARPSTASAAPDAIEIVGARAARHGEHAATELRASARRDERARRAPRLDDERRLGERRDDAVARRELSARAAACPARTRRAGRPRAATSANSARVAIGIDDVDAAAEHGERHAARRRARPDARPRRCRARRPRRSRSHRRAADAARPCASRQPRRGRGARADDREAALGRGGQPSDVPERFDRLRHRAQLGRKADLI